VILISAWVMALAALRDRAALAMTFVLPAVLFLVFAAIFSGASGKDLKLKIGLLDLAHTSATARFSDALAAEKSLRVIPYQGVDASPMLEAVGRGGRHRHRSGAAHPQREAA
jgi:ABC-2 type transport system permease protein